VSLHLIAVTLFTGFLRVGLLLTILQCVVYWIFLSLLP